MSNLTVSEKDLHHIHNLVLIMKARAETHGRGTHMYSSDYDMGWFEAQLGRINCKLKCMFPKENEGEEVPQQDIVIGIDQQDDEPKKLA